MAARIKPKNAKTVEAYMAALTPEDRADLDRLREVVLQASPWLGEGMHDGMPTYIRDGAFVCALAAQKNYLCFYTCNAELLKEHQAALKHLNVGKGCIRFKRLAELPLGVVRAIVKEMVRKTRG